MQLLTIKNVKDILKCTRQHVYNLIKRGDLVSVKDRGFVRVPEKNLKEYISKCTTI